MGEDSLKGYPVRQEEGARLEFGLLSGDWITEDC